MYPKWIINQPREVRVSKISTFWATLMSIHEEKRSPHIKLHRVNHVNQKNSLYCITLPNCAIHQNRTKKTKNSLCVYTILVAMWWCWRSLVKHSYYRNWTSQFSVNKWLWLEYTLARWLQNNIVCTVYTAK